MTELLTAAQMRAIETAAIDSGEVTGLELMERAGRGVVEAILEWRPELAKTTHRAVVLCGPGNNGGDGFVVARLLKERGWEVEVFLYGDEAKLPPDAAENCRRWRELGRIRRFINYEVHRKDVDLYVDAFFGSGLKRAISHEITDFIGHTERLMKEDNLYKVGARTVSIDFPSGLCADSGRAIPFAIDASLTVTFHQPKIGHMIHSGPEHCGRLAVKDIGLENLGSTAKVMDAVGREIVWLCSPRYVCSKDLSQPQGVLKERAAHKDSNNLSLESELYLQRQAASRFGGFHKYTHGHALILSSGVGRGGAARLAARGALRVGAGLVTVGPPPAAIIENAAQLNAIMLRPVADADALAEILKDDRLNALCLGPGLGIGARTLGLVAAALGAKRGTVLDADALTSFAEDPPKLFALLHEKCVLTPHLGEFARLFPDLAAKLAEPPTKGPAYSKVDAAREAAARAGCVVLLKGADTVIADPQGRAAINSAHYQRAAPWLATAGSGDVLAGLITGLLARGLAPMAAAETAAWLHVEAARKFGPGLIAEDLPEMIPAVFRDLGL